MTKILSVFHHVEPHRFMLINLFLQKRFLEVMICLSFLHTADVKMKLADNSQQILELQNMEFIFIIFQNTDRGR